MCEIRRAALMPSLLAVPDGLHRRNPDFEKMVFFEESANHAELTTFTPNEIMVHVTVRRPGVLVINQIHDCDWRPSEGALVGDSTILAVSLPRVGEYDVRLRYAPSLLFIGLGVSLAMAVGGGALLLLFPAAGPQG